MIVIKFGRWNSFHARKFVYKRIRIHGYKWTPFCKITKRRLAKLNAVEALYGFGGWLTTRDEETVMSSGNDAATVAELINEFIVTNNLGDVSDVWPSNLIHPPMENK